MLKCLSAAAAALMLASISGAKAQTQSQAHPRQAQITIKAVGGFMNLRVNGARVGELKTHESYVGTVPAGKVVVSVNQKWKVGWKSFTFIALANKSNTFYVRASDLYRTSYYCSRVNKIVRRHWTQKWAKVDPFISQDIARCKEENSASPPQATTNQ